jgi:hypothetical protein
LAIFNRIPKAAHIAAVYAVIMFIIYSWTLLWFFWKYPSWSYFMNIGEILGVLAYSLANCFAESLVVLIFPVLAAVFLPKKWFYDGFIARGMALVLPILGYMIYIAYQTDGALDYPSQALDWAPVILAATFLLVFLVGRISFLRRALEALADRMTIFIYIFLPLSIISIIVVAIQLIF